LIFPFLLCASVYLAVKQGSDLKPFCRPGSVAGVCRWVSWRGGACPLLIQLLLRRPLCSLGTKRPSPLSSAGSCPLRAGVRSRGSAGGWSRRPPPPVAVGAFVAGAAQRHRHDRSVDAFVFCSPAPVSSPVDDLEPKACALARGEGSRDKVVSASS